MAADGAVFGDVEQDDAEIERAIKIKYLKL